MKIQKILPLFAAALLSVSSCALLGSRHLPEGQTLTEVETVLRIASPRHTLAYNTRGYLDLGYYVAGDKKTDGGYIERSLQTPDLSREIVLSAKPRTNVWSVTWTVNATRPQQTAEQFRDILESSYGPCTESKGYYYWKIPYEGRTLNTTLRALPTRKVELKMSVN